MGTLSRPRSNSEILDAAFALYRRHWSALAPAALLLYLPQAILTLSLDVNAISAKGFSPRLMIKTALSLVAYGFADWTLQAGLSAAYQTGRIDWGVALRRVVGLLPNLLGLTLVFWALVFLGTIVFVVPGIWVYCAFVLFVPVLIVEGPSAPAWERARFLSDTRRGRLAWLMAGAATLAATLAMGAGALLHEGLVHKLVGLVSQALMLPFSAGVLLLAYDDRRARREGYDLLARNEALAPPRSGLA